MTINELIQLGLLLAAVITIICTQLNVVRQNKLTMFAEYTRRYQDIFMNMPDDIYSGDVPMDERTKRYMRLYFDLCSEEYHLWRHNVIPNKVWELWKEGMQIATDSPIYKEAWNAIKHEYFTDFATYFECEVVNYKRN